jgi:endonuclease/exonuclease/phosphatase family metal-dependent hydrolase
VVVHLKSRRPDYRAADTGDDPQLFALASLRSLIRRGTEAAALRVLLSELGRSKRRPRVVLGDFNDVADAVTTGIVLGIGASSGDRLYDACQLQRRQDRLRHVGFSSVHDGHTRPSTISWCRRSSIPRLPGALGEVVDVVYLNDHLELGLPEASDHGQVLARLRLFEREGEPPGDG